MIKIVLFTTLIVIGAVAVFVISNNKEEAVLVAPIAELRDFVLPDYIQVHPDVVVNEEIQLLITSYDKTRSMAADGMSAEILADYLHFNNDSAKQDFLKLEPVLGEHMKTEGQLEATVQLPDSYAKLFPPNQTKDIEPLLHLVHANSNTLWFAQQTTGLIGDKVIYGQLLFTVPFNIENAEPKIILGSVLIPYDQKYYGNSARNIEPLSLSEARDRALKASALQ